MKILGIDPGYDRLGVSIVENIQDNDILLFSNCVRTDSKQQFNDRLLKIGESVSKIIEKYKPDILSIEKLYFTSNQKTAMYVSQTIGVIIFLARANHMQVFEYTPLQIKAACTGSGRADKKQVMFMLHNLLKINKKIKYDDEYDAIAAALTHSAHLNTSQ